MMYDINFLPQSYLREKKRRRRQIFEVGVVVAMGAVVAILFINSRHSVNVLADQAAELETFAAQAQMTINELENLKKREKKVTRNLSLQRELMQPLDHTNVLTALTDLAPASVTMTVVDVVTHRPKPTAAADPKKKDGKRGKGGKKTQEQQNHLTIAIEGVAATDDHVADFYGALSAHPVFEQVKMESVLPVEFENRIGRRFKLSMLVPLNRQYEPLVGSDTKDETVKQSGGVADAN